MANPTSPPVETVKPFNRFQAAADNPLTPYCMETSEKKCLWCGNAMPAARNNKKFCSNRCKMQSFYSRRLSGAATLSQTVEQTAQRFNGQNVLTGKEKPPVSEITYPLETFSVSKASLYCTPLPLNVQRFAHDTATGSPLTTTKNSMEGDKVVSQSKEQHEPAYNWIQSELMDEVTAIIERSPAIFRFLYPEDFFAIADMDKIKWVTVRLRAITEQVLRFSEQSQVSLTDFERLYEALNGLTGSFNFRYLPAKYPLTDFAKDLAVKMNTLLVKFHAQKHFNLTLKQSTKAELIARRYEMAALIGAVKFSELDFTDS